MTEPERAVSSEITQLVAELKKSTDEDRLVAHIEDVRRTLGLKVDNARNETAALRRDLNGRVGALERARERAEGIAEGAKSVRDQVFEGQQKAAAAEQQSALRRFAKWGVLATLAAAAISSVSAIVAVLVSHVVG